jgi:hypothetical protein
MQLACQSAAHKRLSHHEFPGSDLFACAHMCPEPDGYVIGREMAASKPLTKSEAY